MTPAHDPLTEAACWAADAQPSRVPGADGRNRLDLEQFIADHLNVRRGPIDWAGHGEKWVVDCPFNPDHVGCCAVVTRTTTGVIGFGCQHNSCADKGWRDLRQLFDEPRPRVGGAAEVTLSHWPEPQPLQSELPPVDAFSNELLPECFRTLTADVADRMQVPLDYPAIPVVTCLADCVSRRAIIQPKANDSGWLAVPNLWGGIIGPPGFMKTPVIQTAARPVCRIEAEWRRKHDEAQRSFARLNEEYELRLAAWREQVKAAPKRGGVPPARPDDAPEEPKLQRLIINDATFEALQERMSENPAGILLLRDQLTGWWTQLDKPGREGERAFALKSWDGNSGYTIDRIGRGTIHVEACCMSIVGGIQPARLRSYLTNALEDGPSNDGLMQRFQLLVWPDTPDEFNYVDRSPCASAEEQVSRVYRAVLSLDAVKPARFGFDADAQRVFVDWLGKLERRLRGGDMHSALVCHLAKYRSLMPSLALLFELADRASSVGFDAATMARGANSVTVEHALQAAGSCQYLESHARRIYSCVTTPQMRAARELADMLRRREVGADGRFTARDVYLRGRAAINSPELVKEAAAILQDLGWICEEVGPPGPLGGRPSVRYQVNPRIWK